MNESTQQWIIQVEGREYGPADLATLREWKEDGRVLGTNDARPEGEEAWGRASDIPGLFASTPVQAPPVQLRAAGPASPGVFRICFDTVALYIRGFFPFLGLTLLVVIPSVLSQVTGAVLDETNGVDLDVRALLAGGFSLCMLLLTLAAWPLYIAGIQLLTGELALGRRLHFFDLLNRAVKFWPRVAVLCLYVYLAFTFWTVLPMGVILLIGLGGPSPLSFFLVLAVATVQVWVFGRLFINYLFWQQTAVLDERDVAGALRESKVVARSGHDLPWFKRPLWQGAFIASLWLLFVIGLNLPTLLPAFQEYFRLASTTQDPQKLMQAISALPKPHGIDRLNFALGLLEAMLRPLLGIAFVLTFFAAKSRMTDNDTSPPASEP